MGVDWGDGSVEKSNSTRNYLSNMTHVYANAGKYMISMLPDPDTTMSLIPDTNSGASCITPYSRNSDHYENLGYTYTVEKVEIGRNVVLGKWSFACCVHMRSISIPAYIQSIGESGFEQCYQLKMLVLPRGLDTINDHMLSYCKSLESISIPYTVSGSSGSGGKSEGGDDSNSGSKTGGSGSRVLNEGVVWNGRVTASSLNVRTWAGTENPVVSFSPLKKGTKIGVCDELKAQGHEKWYYIEFKGRHGFVCGKYVERV